MDYDRVLRVINKNEKTLVRIEEIARLLSPLNIRQVGRIILFELFVMLDIPLVLLIFGRLHLICYLECRD